ncbi:MAG: hypothetical protein JNN25_01310 [Candidatus Kapabacteria bacterium]|nr:hypothetical protein [Candidatus Kapabacteria bacterium]
MKPEKTEDEKLKELFSTYLDRQHTKVPDFSEMWAIAAHNAAKINARRIRTAWAIAASVAICIVIGSYMLLNRQENAPVSEIQVVSWSEPTKSLMVPKSGLETETLSGWTSPTNFLLPENSQRIKTN